MEADRPYTGPKDADLREVYPQSLQYGVGGEPSGQRDGVRHKNDAQHGTFAPALRPMPGCRYEAYPCQVQYQIEYGKCGVADARHQVDRPVTCPANSPPEQGTRQKEVEEGSACVYRDYNGGLPFSL